MWVQRGWRVVSAMVIGVGAALWVMPTRAAGPWYVSPIGTDSNSCSSPAAPCRTVNAAIGKASSGDTILVAVGVYTTTDYFVASVDKALTLSGGWDVGFTQQVGLSTLDGEGHAGPMSIGCTQPEPGGQVMVSRFEITSDQADHVGINIWCAARVWLDQVKVHGNGFAGINNTAFVTVTRSEISRNGLDLGVSQDGIYNTGAITIENSTLHGNTGSGLYGYFGSTARLVNVTVTGNSTGVYGSGDSTLIGNSILAENTQADCFDYVLSAPRTIFDHSLVQNNQGCGAQTAALIGVEPALGPLQNNGGPTDTRAPVGGSPVVKSGTPGGCVAAAGSLLGIDQRGAPRSGRCDIGAYAAVLTVNKTAPTAVIPGGILTYTLTLSNATDSDLAQSHLSDVVPVPLVVLPGSATASTGVVTILGNTLQWTGTVASGLPTVITVSAQVPADAPRQVFTNTARADWNGFVSASNAAVFDTFHRLSLPALADQHCADFADSFGSSSSGWPTADTLVLRQEYLNGEYRLLTKQGGVFPVQAPTCLRDGYTVDVDARWASSSGGSLLGLTFGSSAGSMPAYRLTLNTDQRTYGIDRYQSSGTWVVVVPHGFRSEIQPGTAVNHLTVKRLVQPDAIQISINGTHVLTTYDSTYTGLGAVGLVVVNDVQMPVVDARFDNFSVVQAP